MVKSSAFLALEASLSDRLGKLFGHYVLPQVAKVSALVDAGEFDKAELQATTIHTFDLFEAARGYVDWISALSMLFGASRVSKRPNTTVVGLGHESLMRQQAVALFCTGYPVVLDKLLSKQIVQLIAARRADAKDGKGAYLRLKADKPKLISYDPKKRVLDPLGSFVDSSGKAFFNTVSSLHSSRLAAYGFTAEASALGIEEYAISEQLDPRICPVCRYMHGMRFPVKQARSLLDTVLRVTAVEDFKALQPWPSQSKAGLEELKSLTREELISRGLHIPPFHPRCRGLLTKPSKTPTLEAVLSGTASDELPEATLEDFAFLGYDLTPDKVKKWNKAVGIKPMQLLADMQGKSLTDYLTAVMGADVPSDASGLQALSVTKKGVSLKLKGPMQGTKAPVSAAISFDPEGDQLSIDSLQVDDSEKATPFLRKFMRAAYSLAGDTGATKLGIGSVSDYGSYAFAKAGFKPSESDWGTLKNAVLKKAASKKTTAAIDKLLLAIKSSSDPADIYALASTTFGKDLLMGLHWSPVLDLESQEAVARFFYYFGEAS